MSNSELSPLSAIKDRLQRLREGSELYIAPDRSLKNLQVNSEDSSNNSSRSYSEEEEDILEIENVATTSMAETIRQLLNGTEGEIVPLCITYPEPAKRKEADFELKSGFLHQLARIPISTSRSFSLFVGACALRTGILVFSR